MTSEAQILERQIQAVRNSPPYRRLIMMSRGPRENQELNKLNLQISTLEFRRTEALKRQKPLNKWLMIFYLITKRLRAEVLPA